MIKSKLVNNVFSLGIVQIVNFIFPLITIPYVSRIIGPDGYGIINYATAFIGYFVLLIGYGFDLTATRRVAKVSHDSKALSEIASEILSARVLLFFLSSIIFLFSILFLKPIQNDITVVVVLFVGCISNVISPQFLFQGMQELSIFAKINFLRGIVNTGLVFLLIHDAEDYLWLPLLTVFFSIGINFFLIIFAINKFKVRYRLISVKKSMNLISSEKLVFFSTVIISLYTTTNTVVLGFFAENKEIGYYTTSHSFLGIVNNVLTIPLSTALFPFVGKAFEVSRENGISTIKRIIPIVAYLTFLASVFLLIFAPFLIGMVYGDKFDLSIPALRILSFLPFLIAMSNIFGIQIMLNLQLDRLFFKLTSIVSIIGILFNIVMSKYYGYIGTAWSCLVVESFVTLLMYFSLRKRDIKVFEPSYFIPANILLMIKTNFINKKNG